jgi:hypothetical protein
MLATEVVAGDEPADAGGVRALGAAGVLGDGVDVTGGVTTVRTLAGGAAGVGVGVVTGGAVTGGAGELRPGTVTVTGDTSGVVTDGLVAFAVVAAPLGRDSMANIVNSATVSRMPTRIGRRAATSAERATAATRCLLFLPSTTLDIISLPSHRASLRRCRRPPTETKGFRQCRFII